MVEKKSWKEIIYNRGQATYKKGFLDFSYGEGGNHHIFAKDLGGHELGYIWFDDHCGGYGFCGRGQMSCRGIFAEVLALIDPKGWKDDQRGLYDFTEQSFSKMMKEVIRHLK